MAVLHTTWNGKTYYGCVPYAAAVAGLCVLCLALPIASLAIAQNNRTVACDEPLVSLVTWLLVYGSVSLVVNVCAVILPAILFGIAIGCNCETGATCVGGCTIFVSVPFVILYGLFSLVWSVLGAISLFANDVRCLREAETLWIITLVDVCWIWLLLLRDLRRKIVRQTT